MHGFQFMATPERKAATADQLKQLLKRKAEAKLHLDFVVPLNIEQVEGGRYFLHEHPSQATSWEVGSVTESPRIPGVAGSFATNVNLEPKLREGQERETQ